MSMAGRSRTGGSQAASLERRPQGASVRRKGGAALAKSMKGWGFVKQAVLTAGGRSRKPLRIYLWGSTQTSRQREGTGEGRE
eukprot:scaffold635_cov311-Pinguiococcus_pyrenoidosus.AAC.10